MALQFSSPKLVKYWTGSAWAESQDFGGYIKIWNGTAWQYVAGARPYFDVPTVNFTTSLTEGSEGTYGSGYARKGYSTTDPPSGDILFPAGIGSLSNSTINKPDGGTTTLLQFVARQVPIKSSLFYSFVFTVSGNQTGTWWNTITYPTVTYSRLDTGNYNSDTDTTSWSVLIDTFAAFTGGTKTLTIT